MIITHYLPQPCPACGKIGEYGNINVSGNVLNRGCNACGNWERIPLPQLKKTIIYLDQFFLSNAFRKRRKEFVTAADRIKDLASKQLVVSPWSSIHELETHLWPNPAREDLLMFIKQSARGHRYSTPHCIKSKQIQRAFDAFLERKKTDKLIESHDAFQHNIHSWDDYVWIDVGKFIDDVDYVGEEKRLAVESLVDLFDEWGESKTTFEEDVIEEVNGYAKSLMEVYRDSCKAFVQGSIIEYLSAPADARLIDILMCRDSNTLNYRERLKRINLFLHSEYFREIPYVDISCRLFAILRKRVKEGQFPNRERAKMKLSGVFYDVEAISIYAPYSDAIFIDRAMHQWLKQEGSDLCNKYSFRIFSALNWEEFYSYLDGIEKNCPEEIQDMLPLVYPD